ncbi:MAG: oligoendopeptidase F [Lachnospiraceae bacterium]|nr:oligoendopeptidase F [Lachnospiraceae bacterium]
MSADVIRKRSEVPEEFTWNLKDIFKSDEAWLKAEKEAGEFVGRARPFEKHLGDDAKTLLAWYRLNDEATIKLESLFGYAHMKSDQDTTNGHYLDFVGRARRIGVMISGAFAFADPEIMKIPDAKLKQFFRDEPELETYRRNIEVLRKRAKHVLSPKEEAILAAANAVSSSPSTINSVLQNADMSWPDVRDGEGKKHPLTNGSFVSLLESPDRAFRRRVFQTYYRELGRFANTVAASLDGQFLQLNFYSNARKYGSTLEASLADTEVPVPVYTNLIQAVHENLQPMYRYVALRKRVLNVRELHMYDVYTPIVQDSQSKVPFEEAKSTILKALSVLGRDYTALLQKGFKNRWIDVYENVGKRSGAYSSGAARPHPYVLLNYKDNLDSMFTLAHEMGHALHSYHSNQAQPVNLSDYVIFVAEVASTVNEVLLMKYLLKETKDKKERAYLINHFLDSFKGTLYRQTMFAEFERFMGEASENGTTLTAEFLKQKYLELNQLYFGPDMTSDPEIALEWARIPHFFYNYYVFQYATGYSAAVAIANRILTEGAPAVKDYKAFLSGGSSKDPISLLKIAGVDMSTPKPVTDALTMFGELVDEMEKLI